MTTILFQLRAERRGRCERSGRRLPSNLSWLASWCDLRVGPIGTFRFYNILDILTILGNKIKCEWNQLLWNYEGQWIER
jgi:hypothetical protein